MATFITHTDPSFPRTADVVVIGGGPAGTAALWALTRAAPGIRAVLLEQSERLGAGSSLASLECYRTCWPAPPLARQMQRSVDVFDHADDYLGPGAAQALAVKRRGYLFCGFTDTQAATLRREVAHLHSIGLTHVEYLDAAEVRYRYSWLGDRVLAAKYDPVAGWLDSNALIHRFVHASDAQVVTGVGEVRITVDGGCVTGVQIPGRLIAAPRVVIACGASAINVGRTAGIELPLVMRPRQSFTTAARHDAFPDDAPMVIGAAPHPHVRPEAGSGAIFGWEYAWNTKNIRGAADEGVRDSLTEPVYPLAPLKDPRFPSLTLALLARQFGHAEGEGFNDPRYLRGLHHNIGYYVSRGPEAAHTTLPDGTRRPYDSQRALIDAHPDVTGLFVSVAHVGHGIMTAPAAGEILASHVLGTTLPDPLYTAFGFAATWVEHDENAL